MVFGYVLERRIIHSDFHTTANSYVCLQLGKHFVTASISHDDQPQKPNNSKHCTLWVLPNTSSFIQKFMYKLVENLMTQYIYTGFYKKVNKYFWNNWF